VFGKVIERALEGGGIVGVAVAASVIIALRIAPTRERSHRFLVTEA
jgi:hypothetical protein